MAMPISDISRKKGRKGKQETIIWLQRKNS